MVGWHGLSHGYTAVNGLNVFKRKGQRILWRNLSHYCTANLSSDLSSSSLCTTSLQTPSSTMRTLKCKSVTHTHTHTRMNDRNSEHTHTNAYTLTLAHKHADILLPSSPHASWIPYGICQVFLAVRRPNWTPATHYWWMDLTIWWEKKGFHNKTRAWQMSSGTYKDGILKVNWRPCCSLIQAADVTLRRWSVPPSLCSAVCSVLALGRRGLALA